MNSPASPRWGDYLTIRPEPVDEPSWVAAGYSIGSSSRGEDAHVTVLQFHRTTPPPASNVAAPGAAAMAEAPAGGLKAQLDRIEKKLDDLLRKSNPPAPQP